MRKWLLPILLLALPVLTQAQVTTPASPGGVDPCATPVKTIISVTISTATTTQLLALSAGKAIYVCSGIIDIAGSATTAGSVQFEYGTGASCGTGTQTLTGVMAGSTTAGTPTVIPINGGGGTTIGTIAGQALCVVSAGTTVSITGFLTVVQQ